MQDRDLPQESKLSAEEINAGLLKFRELLCYAARNDTDDLTLFASTIARFGLFLEQAFPGKDPQQIEEEIKKTHSALGKFQMQQLWMLNYGLGFASAREGEEGIQTMRKGLQGLDALLGNPEERQSAYPDDAKHKTSARLNPPFVAAVETIRNQLRARLPQTTWLMDQLIDLELVYLKCSGHTGKYLGEMGVKRLEMIKDVLKQNLNDRESFLALGKLICSEFVKKAGGEKNVPKYVEYLNNNLRGHHFGRLLGILVEDAQTRMQTPFLLVESLVRLPGYPGYEAANAKAQDIINEIVVVFFDKHPEHRLGGTFKKINASTSSPIHKLHQIRTAIDKELKTSSPRFGLFGGSKSESPELAGLKREISAWLTLGPPDAPSRSRGEAIDLGPYP